MAVAVRRLGLVGYRACLSLQQQLVHTYKDEITNQVGELLLVEHPSVYTLGLREKSDPVGVNHLQLLGAEVCKTRRGGLTTYHGPGQLVCYPILNLRRIGMGIRQYICSLEQTIINAVSHLGVEAQRCEHTGVWVGENKLCAIGVQVSMGVAYHGLAINCSTDLEWFKHITPCGVEGKGVTSLTELLKRKVTVEEFSPLLVQSLSATLGFEVQ